MEESCDQSESEIEVSDDSDNYFGDNNNTGTVHSTSSDGSLNNWSSLEINQLVMLEINPLVNLCRKNRRKLWLHIKYTHHQCGIHLRKLKPFSFPLCLPNTQGVIPENIKHYLNLQLVNISLICCYPNWEWFSVNGKFMLNLLTIELCWTDW